MQLFKISNNSLDPIDKNSFKLEKDIQQLVESNLETLFALEFVSSEFTILNFRLDSLAYDIDNNSFVIIEYKKGHSYSVIDQGYCYLSVMFQNKAAFILEYNEKTGKQLRRDDINWGSSKVIFVSPAFNTFQRNSVNFKDMPFELWEIKKFDNNIIAVEKYVSTSNESINQLSKVNTNSAISKVAEEIKIPTAENHLKDIDDSLRIVWDSLQDKLKDLNDSSFKVTNSYISLIRENTAVCFFKFRTKNLRIFINQGVSKPNGDKAKNFFTLDDPKQQTKIKSWVRENGNTVSEYVINISKEEELDYLMYLLEQKYNSLN